MGRKMLSHQQFVDRVKTTSPDVTILGQYTGASNRIKVKCNKCGNEWNVIANSLIQGSGCNKCKPIFNKITHDEFMQKLDNKGILEKIEILSTYKTVKDRIKCKTFGWQHSSYEAYWETKGTNFYNQDYLEK